MQIRTVYGQPGVSGLNAQILLQKVTEPELATCQVPMLLEVNTMIHSRKARNVLASGMIGEVGESVTNLQELTNGRDFVRNTMAVLVKERTDSYSSAM